jgi:hypothetical protein
MDYDTICQHFGWIEWPNLKERIHEPDVQTAIQAFKDAIDHYDNMWKTYETTQTAENEEACYYAEWRFQIADRRFCNLVEKAFHPPMEPYPEWLRKKKYQQKIDAIIPLDKVLPDVILDIIRQFSKPAFIHFREYNQALALFHLTPSYRQKLKKKIVVPLVREQLKICVDAHDDYHKIQAVYLHHKTPLNEEFSDKSRYWADVSKNKFVALLDETEYYQQGYAAWYFQDDIDDAWMTDLDDDPMTAEEDRLVALNISIRMEKKETRMMEGEDLRGDRRGLNECYDGLDGLYTVLSV